MANYKYIDFEYAPYQPGRIILHADPVTGGLNKIPIEQLQKGQYRLKTISGPFAIPVDDYEAYFEYAIPANTFKKVGDTLDVVIFANTTEMADYNYINYYINGQMIFEYECAAASWIKITMQFVYLGSNTIMSSIQLLINTTIIFNNANLLTGFNPAVNWDTYSECYAGTGDSFILNYELLNFTPAE